MSDYDKASIAGEHGAASQMAMSIILRMQSILGFDQLMDISAAHIDSTVYMGIATMEFAERLASLGAKVAVPSTLNVSGVDETGWRSWSVPPEHAANAYRQMVAYESMGCIPTWTCAPYQTEHRPVFGQQVAAGESNAIAFFNSIIGARTERYPDLLDICCAITGRVPKMGLHLSQNRAGDLHVILEDDVPDRLMESDVFFPVIGHIMGQLAGQEIPVLSGLRGSPSEDQLKAVCAAAATSGGVAMFHIVGVTPEAATESDAFLDSIPRQTYRIGRRELRTAYEELSTLPEGSPIELVLLGSPHFSVDEFRRLANLVKGRKCAGGVRMIVTCSRVVREIVKSTEMGVILEDFGVSLTVDTCPLTTPMLGDSRKTIVTNSAKYALYSPGLLNADAAFGSLEDCVESAVQGKYIVEGSEWE
ncbi:MAG: DUF521 domain-containing protein [Rhodothermales bacterium]|nr:DUF521 domain-containing protein [Rhodothermales bacterium]